MKNYTQKSYKIKIQQSNYDAYYIARLYILYQFLGLKIWYCVDRKEGIMQIIYRKVEHWKFVHNIVSTEDLT